jgi:uncharacterized protein YabN with tetrapyrrole methylase and pyrophosphatase domain
MESVSRALPGLWQAEKLQGKAAKVGYDWPDADTAFQKIPEETEELRAAIDAAGFGDAAFFKVRLEQ